MGKCWNSRHTPSERERGESALHVRKSWGKHDAEREYGTTHKIACYVYVDVTVSICPEAWYLLVEHIALTLNTRMNLSVTLSPLVA